MARTLPIRLRTIAAAAVVVASGLIIWSAYQSIINTTDPTSQTLPIIKADTKPFRVLPENPGGAEIPNQGSRLFNVLNAENADDLALSGVKIDREEEEPETIITNDTKGTEGFELPEMPETRRESLYSDVETLKDRKAIADDPDLEEIDEESKAELNQKLAQVVEQSEENNEAELSSPPTSGEPEIQTPVQDGGTEVIIPARKPTPTSRPVVQAEPTPAPAQTTEAPKEFSVDRILASEPTKDSYYIQLASLRSEEAAREAYGRIRDNHPKLVEGVSVVFPRADLGSRGTFYRIQIGPLSSTEAKIRCDEYRAKARGGTCLVVSR